MIEKDIAHLKFLSRVAINGDIPNSDDIDFVIRIESELKVALGYTKFIRERVVQACENC